MTEDLRTRARDEEIDENYEAAIILYRALLDEREEEGLTHRDATTLIRLGALHLERDEATHAVSAFREAGDLYREAGLRHRAIAIYRRILRIRSAHQGALCQLAGLHVEMGLTADAVDYAERLAQSCIERDTVETAVECLRGLFRETNERRFGLILAELLSSCGETTEAHSLLTKLEQSPDGDEIDPSSPELVVETSGNGNGRPQGRTGEQGDGIDLRPSPETAADSVTAANDANPGTGLPNSNGGHFRSQGGGDEPMDISNVFGREDEPRDPRDREPDQPDDEETPPGRRYREEGRAGERRSEASRPRGADGEPLSERDELRRGLSVLDELIELDPSRMELYRRRISYARRLSEKDEVVRTYLKLAASLRTEGSPRGARLVYEHVLRIDPEIEKARAGIEDLDERSRDHLPESGEEDGYRDVPPDDYGAADAGPLSERILTELERVVGQLQWLQRAARLMRSRPATEPPPVTAYELAGRYFLSIGDVEKALDTLTLAKEVGEYSDEELVDVHFQLGLCQLRRHQPEEALRYFELVGRFDEPFRQVYEWLLESGRRRELDPS